MAIFYAYSDVILGTQSTIDGNVVNYAFAPTGDDWRYTGSDTYFVAKKKTVLQISMAIQQMNKFQHKNNLVVSESRPSI